MRDKDIRTELLAQLSSFAQTDDSTRIVSELGLCQGEARIDVAVINGSLHGYEIKSERDTLQRLPNQSRIYSQIFDYMTLVTSRSHLKLSEAHIPTWWGISVANMESGKVHLVTIRTAAYNEAVDKVSLAQLLWREEVVSILFDHNALAGFKSKPRKQLWERLASIVTENELRTIVRQTLKNRQDWRADSIRT